MVLDKLCDVVKELQKQQTKRDTAVQREWGAAARWDWSGAESIAVAECDEAIERLEGLRDSIKEGILSRCEPKSPVVTLK